jgi:signal peptidase
MSAPTAERAPAVPAASGHHRLRSVGRALGWLAFAAVVLVAGLMLVPTLLGYQRYVIVSGSMDPAIPTGSVVYDRVVPVEELAVGDVITFVPPAEYGIDEPVTHRIVDIATGERAGAPVIRTKGDANDSLDAWHMVPDDPGLPRVEHHIEWLGYVYLALSHRWIQLLVIGLPALVISVLVIRALWREAGEAVMREEAEAAA